MEPLRASRSLSETFPCTGYDQEGTGNRTEPAEPNRTEPFNLERARAGRGNEPNRTGPNHDASKSAGRTASNRDKYLSEPNRTEPNRLNFKIYGTETNRTVPSCVMYIILKEKLREGNALRTSEVQRIKCAAYVQLPRYIQNIIIIMISIMTIIKYIHNNNDSDSSSNNNNNNNSNSYTNNDKIAGCRAAATETALAETMLADRACILICSIHTNT